MPATPITTALLAVAHAAAPAPVHDLDAAVIGDTLARFNAVAQMPVPELTDAQHRQLADGDVVTVVHRRGDGRYVVVGYARAGVPKVHTWLATQDPHYRSNAAVEEPLHVGPHESTWYHRADIPRPFADRHWVVDVWDNVDLAHESDGAFWEHPWQLREGGIDLVRARVRAGAIDSVTLDDLDQAVETPVNDGAFDFLDLPGGDDSLFHYVVVASTGGGIPDRLVAAFMRANMASSMEETVARAQTEVPGHYCADHAPVAGLDGVALARFE